MKRETLIWTILLVVGLGAGILSILPFIGAFFGFAIAMALTLSVSTSFLTIAMVVWTIYRQRQVKKALKK